MIKFLFKGIKRDASRSRLPIIVVSIGALLTVFLSGYIRGAMGDVIDLTARFQTGHLKVMTQPYYENMDQLPNDLALVEVDSLLNDLRRQRPEHLWVARTRFGGLVDVPTEDGETKSQGPASGMAIELFNEEMGEVDRLNIQKSMVRGNIPAQSGEALLSEDFAQRLGIEVGQEFTFFGSTMEGAMTFTNFTLAGTVRFGNSMLDRGSVIVDLSDAQEMLDMYDAAGEIYGFYSEGAYFNDLEKEHASAYNAVNAEAADEYKPVMYTLGQQNDMEGILVYSENMGAMFVAIFVFAMSLVLWNTGLIGGLRRYQEFGIRLALGESKGGIYRTLILEAVLIGMIGSVIGTALGVFGCYLLQRYGIDISGMMPESSMMYPSVIRAKVTPDLFVIGFIPGLFSMVLGNMLAGVGIYKRETAQLFKELEV